MRQEMLLRYHVECALRKPIPTTACKPMIHDQDASIKVKTGAADHRRESHVDETKRHTAINGYAVDVAGASGRFQQTSRIDKIHRIVLRVRVVVEALRIANIARHWIRTGPSARRALILPPAGGIQSSRVGFEHRLLLTIRIR